MKKKVLAILLSAAMTAVLLAGCGSGDAGNNAAEEPAAEESAAQEPAESGETAEEPAASTETRTIKILSMWPEDDAESTANGYHHSDAAAVSGGRKP